MQGPEVGFWGQLPRNRLIESVYNPARQARKVPRIFIARARSENPNGLFRCPDLPCRAHRQCSSTDLELVWPKTEVQNASNPSLSPLNSGTFGSLRLKVKFGAA